MSEIELSKDLFSLTISQLRQLAKDNNVPVVGTRKADIIFVLQEAGINSTEGLEIKEEPKVEEKPRAKKVEKEVKEEEITATKNLALYSERNLSSAEFGRLNVGYNIVSPAQKDFWLNLKPGVVREATPKEVAKYYGVK